MTAPHGGRTRPGRPAEGRGVYLAFAAAFTLTAAVLLAAGQYPSAAGSACFAAHAVCMAGLAPRPDGGTR